MGVSCPRRTAAAARRLDDMDLSRRPRRGQNPRRRGMGARACGAGLSPHRHRRGKCPGRTLCDGGRRERAVVRRLALVAREIRAVEAADHVAQRRDRHALFGGGTRHAARSAARHGLVRRAHEMDASRGGMGQFANGLAARPAAAARARRQHRSRPSRRSDMGRAF